MEQFWAFLKKEFWHILRDKRTMLILLVMPVVLIVLFGYAVTTEVKNTRVAVLDLAKDEATARAIGHIAANRYFSLSAQADCMADVDDLFRRGEAVESSAETPHAAILRISGIPAYLSCSRQRHRRPTKWLCWRRCAKS